MQHASAAQAFGPEVIVESFLPILKAEIAELAPLLPRIPRQATYQTYILTPGQITQILGFDASRQRAVLITQGGFCIVSSERSAMETWNATTGTLSGALAGFSIGTQPVELRNQGELWVTMPKANAGTGTVILSVLSESHSFA